MSMELIKNIKALTKIQLKQNKNKLIILICIMAALMLISNSYIMFLYKVVEADTFFANVSKMTSIFLYGICMISPFFTTNILTNKNISMYPGTNRSRFISRVISDNIAFLEVVIFSIFIYCIEYPILLAIKGGNPDISLAFVFDIKYALVSMVYILSYYFMAYGILVFLYALATAIGAKKSIFYYTVFFALFIILIQYHVISLNSIINYIKNEDNLGIFLLKTWSIWLVTIVCAYLIANSLKIMKDEIIGKFIIVPVGFVVIILISFISNIGVTYHSTNTGVAYYSSYSDSDASRYGELKTTDIYKETLVKCNDLNVKDMINNKNNMNNIDLRLVISQEKAYHEGILDNKISLQDEVLVITFFPDGKCKNQYLYQSYLDNMTISNEGAMLKFNIPNKKTILNFLWGDSYKFLSGYDIDENDSLNNPNFKPIVYIIYPDNIVAK